MVQQETPSRLSGGIYAAGVGFCALLIALALLLDSPAAIWQGLGAIVASDGALITDYMALAGPGAALVNAALVTLSALLVFRLAGAELAGNHVFVLGLMSGFALFGKNIFNLWPFVLGSFLYARFRGEPFSRHCNMGLLCACLGPMVSLLCWSGGPLQFLLGLLLGVALGFAACPLSAVTLQLLKGLNLYNGGFACGLLAYVGMPVLLALGKAPRGEGCWATALERPLGLFVAGLCLLCLAGGLFLQGWEAFPRLLRDSGQAPCDFLRRYGPGAVLLNMCFTGLMSLGYLLLIGGDLNGPTLGCIFTVMGFSAYGKHPGNILPVLSGIALAAALLPGLSLTAPGVQMAALLGTTLAPMAGVYGWPAGVLAGFLHLCLVVRTGIPVAGVNLYNNGFSGGLVAVALSPLLSAVLEKGRKNRENGPQQDA